MTTHSSNTRTHPFSDNSKAEHLMRCLTIEMINYHLGVDGDDLAESYHGDEAVETVQQATAPNLPTVSKQRISRASQMSSEEIAEELKSGVDPYAQSLCHAPVRRAKQPPLTDLLAAMHLVQISAQNPELDDLFRPGVTAIIVEDDEQKERLEPSLALALRFFCEAHRRPVDAIECVALVEHSARPASSTASRRREELDTFIARGTPVLALVRDISELSDSGKSLLRQQFKWPDIDQATIIDLLRATHSATYEVAETELGKRLPENDVLKALPRPVIAYAFTADTTVKVADLLASAKIPELPATGKTLADICGLPQIVEELQHLAFDVRAWRNEEVDWSDVTSSFLFSGPPGTGKTMLAEAVAGSAKANFVSTSYADNQAAGHLGDYLRAVAKKVDQAISEAPAVFFIDELDSFRERSGRSNHSAQYMHAVVNGLLTQLTRLNEAPGVIVIGATNHPEIIDPAILRAGRFDRKIQIGMPDKDGISGILSGVLGFPEKQLRHLSARLVGQSGAEIAAVARSAKTRARRCREPLRIAHLEAVIEAQFPELARDLLFRKAVHESGHAVVAHVLEMPPADRVYIAQDGGGYEAQTLPMVTSEQAHYELTVLLAGRAAEEVCTGEISTGSGGDKYSDLAKATDLAVKLEQQFGFGRSLIHAPIPRKARHKIPEKLRCRIDARLSMAFELAGDLIVEHRELVERVAAALIEHRELDRSALHKLLTTKTEWRGTGLEDTQ